MSTDTNSDINVSLLIWHADNVKQL